MKNINSNRQQIADKWKNSSVFSEETKKEVSSLEKEQPEQFYDAFYRDIEFGTGGLRGVMGVGTNRINTYTIAKATQGLANHLNDKFSKPKVCIAFDCRNNSLDFAKKTADILSANQIEVYIFPELRPTPLLSFSVRNLKAQAGIVITASHNPKEYNGYKVYNPLGGQIVPPDDTNLIDIIKNIDYEQIKQTPDNSKIHWLDEKIDKSFMHLAIVHSYEHEDSSLKNIKVAFSPIHGTAHTLLVPAFDSLKIPYFTHPQQIVPDGDFTFTKSSNPEEKIAFEGVLQIAEKNKCDIALVTDPDADRLGVAIWYQNSYVLINGNQLASILTHFMINKNKKVLDKYFVGSTIVTTELLDEICEKNNIKIEKTLTGFKWIADRIHKNEGKFSFLGGGEESFGYLIGDFVRDKDSITTSLLTVKVAEVLKQKGKTLIDYLIEIYQENGFYYETLFSLSKKGEQGMQSIRSIMDFFENKWKTLKINDLSVATIENYKTLIKEYSNSSKKEKLDIEPSDVIILRLINGTKIAVRPSGTEPKIKFYIAKKGEYKNDISFDKNIQTQNSELQSIEKQIQELIKEF